MKNSNHYLSLLPIYPLLNPRNVVDVQKSILRLPSSPTLKRRRKRLEIALKVKKRKRNASELEELVVSPSFPSLPFPSDLTT
jgi:hypothetical protein